MSCFARSVAAACILALAGCAVQRPAEEGPSLTPAQARTLIAKLLPAEARDRAGWATDIYAAFATLRIAPTP